LALAGVVLLTQPWQGDFNLPGVAWAALAACGWGVYILLTQRLGDRFSGIGSLTITVPIAALAAAAVGIPQAAGHLTLEVLAAAAGLAVLLPVLPFALEMLALRRMTPTAFGTLMALEPAVGVLLGLLILHQQPSPVQVAGILLVVLPELLPSAAAAGGTRRSRLPPRTWTSWAEDYGLCLRPLRGAEQGKRRLG
jgi:inner membrane transporter RhtA